MIIRALWILGLAVAVQGLASTALAHEVEKPAIAALNLRAVAGMSADVADLLSEAVLSRLKQSGRFGSVLGSSDMQAMLDLEQQKQALGCDQESCLAELGDALGVPYLLVASLGPVGKKIMLNMKIIRVDEAQVANRMSQVYDDENALLAALNDAVDSLIVGSFKADAEVLTASSSKASAVPAKAKSSRPKVVPQTPWLGMSVAATGLTLSMAGYVYTARAEETLLREQNVASYQALEDAVGRANIMVAAGWTLSAVGVWLWKSPL